MSQNWLKLNIANVKQSGLYNKRGDLPAVSVVPENHTDGLISEWLFDDGSGNTITDSVGSNNVDMSSVTGQSFTHETYGIRMSGGAFVTGRIDAGRTLVALVRTPNQQTGGFMLSGGDNAANGILQGQGYVASSGVAHIGGGFGVHTLKQNSSGSAANAYETNGGGWVLIFMNPTNTIDTAWGLGGRAQTSNASNRAAQLDVAWAALYDDVLLDSERTTIWNYVGYLLSQRGEYLRCSDCPTQRNGIVLTGDSLAEGRTGISSLSVADQNQVFDNVWISVTDSNNIPDFYPIPVFDLGVNQTTAVPAGQFGHELGMAQTAETEAVDLVIVKGSRGGSHFCPVNSNGANDPSASDTNYPEASINTLFNRLLCNFYWTEQYLRNQGIGIDFKGVHIDGGLNDALATGLSGASSTVYQGYYQDWKDEFESYTNVSDYRISITQAHNNDPLSDVTALSRVRDGQAAFITAAGSSGLLLNIDNQTFPDSVHPDATGALATGANAYNWIINEQTPIVASVPDQVTGLLASKGSNSGEVDLTWTAPADNGAAITDYIVEVSLSGLNLWIPFPDGTSTNTSTTVTSLIDGFAYDFRVAAVNSEGTGSYSTTASATPSTVPSQVGTVTPTAGDTQVALAWSAPIDGGSAITDYVVQYKLNSSGMWITFADGTVATTGATVTGLTNGSLYDFRVAAINANGTGAYSAVVSSTPAASSTAIGDAFAALANSTVQAVYDKTDTTGMFVNRNGSGGNPSNGDSVGMLLDRSFAGGNTLGQTCADYITSLPEEITVAADRDFSSDTGFWTLSGGASITGGVLDITGVNNVAVTSNLGLTQGNLIQVTFDKVGTGDIFVYAGVFSSSGESATNIGGTGTITVILPMGTNYDGVRFNSGGTSGVTIDNVSIKELPGRHFIAPDDSSRPVYRSADGGKLEFDGIDDRMVASLFSDGTSDMNIFHVFSTLDTRGVLVGDSDTSNINLGFIQDGDTGGTLVNGSGTPSLEIDSVASAITSRDAFHTAVGGGNWHKVLFEGADLTGWSDIELFDSNSGASRLSGDSVLLVMYNSTGMSAGDETDIETWIDGVVPV